MIPVDVGDELARLFQCFPGFWSVLDIIGKVVIIGLLKSVNSLKIL